MVPDPDIRDMVRHQEETGWYFKGDSTRAGAHASTSPTYPTQSIPNASAKLQ
jgi:hypothetical protein